MKSFIFLTSLLLVASLSVEAGDDGGRRGIYDIGWQPIKNVNDLHVQEVAKFAVDEQNKQSHTSLILYKVDSGKFTNNFAALYRLIVVVADNNTHGILAKYEATVWEKSRGNLQLVSFKWIRP
ncbi:cysteine proteinase inhibitor 1-like [Dendrobium catenatum]|uniref:Cysteine proteinase inhibitor 1 n=1 Tax=Dendrobium catenatum TaxID=906689 RepID=A0A2I0WC98_9ASPA|nr:cysteine proteinase inhibitor 1-like [Dendrobium catenatum]PKU73283.1 Cysteine proteinase inhibitor 1 [Dendrobium catenatum]